MAPVIASRMSVSVFTLHPLTRIGTLSPRDLDGQPFIVREPGSGTRKHMEDFFESRQITPRLAMEMPSNESIKQAVMAGMGLSFLSLHTIGLEVRSGLLAVLPVQGTPIVRTWNVVRLSGKTLSPAAEALRYFILEHGQRHLAEHDRTLLGDAAWATDSNRTTEVAGRPG